MPLVEGQAFALVAICGRGVLVRGVRGEDLRRDRPSSRAISGRARWRVSTRARALPSAAGWPNLCRCRPATRSRSSRRSGAATPFGTAPRIKGYPVKAIFEIGMSEFDSTFVYMPLAEAQTYFNRDDDVHADRGLSSTIPTSVDECARAIEEAGGPADHR